MQTAKCILKAASAFAAACLFAATAQANVWMDENFEGASAFVQGTGVTGTNPPGASLDTYSTNPLSNQVGSVLTQTGAVVSSKAFDGSAKSYQIETGETLAVGEPYQDQANGNFQVFQFAVNVDPIPAAGTVGTFRWNFDTDSGTAPTTTHSYYVRLVSTGTTVNLVAGEDVANGVPPETTIGILESASEWEFVTMFIQKDSVGHTNTSPNMPAGTIAPGMHYYSTGTTEMALIPFAAAPAFVSRNWSFTVDSGTVYLDNVYWDGGLEDDAVNSGVQPFDLGASPSAVGGWEAYD